MPAASTATEKQVVFVCNTCGSEDVVVDAWAAWDKEYQKWELANTFDASHCNSCDRERSIRAIPIS